jgi:histidine triad (HIT) family protein
VIAENDDIIVIESIRPRYASHWLIIPKKHIENIKAAQPEDQVLLGKLMLAAQKLSKQLQAPGDFQFNINNGAHAGQTVFHMHVHFLSASAQTAAGKLTI